MTFGVPHQRLRGRSRRLVWRRTASDGHRQIVIAISTITASYRLGRDETLMLKVGLRFRRASVRVTLRPLHHEPAAARERILVASRTDNRSHICLTFSSALAQPLAPTKVQFRQDESLARDHGSE